MSIIAELEVKVHWPTPHTTVCKQLLPYNCEKQLEKIGQNNCTLTTEKLEDNKYITCVEYEGQVFESRIFTHAEMLPWHLKNLVRHFKVKNFQEWKSNLKQE